MNATMALNEIIHQRNIFDATKVLVLNKCWTPINTITLREAVILLFGEHASGEPKAKIVEPSSYQQMTWADWSKLRPSADDKVIRTASLEFRVPEIIVLSQYDKMPKPKVTFSRRTIFKRDNNTCQYCGCHPKNDELTIDHVQPRAQGGTTTWENCVLACYKCNSHKANRTPKEAGMKLRKQPVKPDVRYFKCDLTYKCRSWAAFLGEMYWQVELVNDNKDE